MQPRDPRARPFYHGLVARRPTTTKGEPEAIPLPAEPIAPSDDESDASDLQHPARLISRLAEWGWSQDPDLLHRSFRRVGLEVNERDPDYHYVHKYYGHNARKLRAGLQDEDFMALAQEVRDAKRTYL